MAIDSVASDAPIVVGAKVGASVVIGVKVVVSKDDSVGKEGSDSVVSVIKLVVVVVPGVSLWIDCVASEDSVVAAVTVSVISGTPVVIGIAVVISDKPGISVVTSVVISVEKVDSVDKGTDVVSDTGDEAVESN